MAVDGPKLLGADVEVGPPSERWAAEATYEVVDGNPAMAAVPVREGVDGDEAVVEPDGQFVGLVRLVLAPSPGVLGEGADGHGDTGEVYPDVGLV